MRLFSAETLRHTFCILVAVFTGFLSTSLYAQTIIEPPFGLRWGDSPEKLISWSAKHSLDIDIFIPGGQPTLRIVKVRPQKGNLPGSTATAVEGKFLSGGLYEMTVHYADAEATVDMMQQRFEKIRKQVILEHGALKPNQQSRVMEDQFVTRKQSFHLEPIRGVFLLIAWTEVEDLLRKSKEARFSLIYRNDNFKEELRKKGKEN